MGRFTTQTHGSGPARAKSIEKYEPGPGPQNRSAAVHEKGKDAEPVQALTKVAGTFRHACPLVMYEDDRSEPVLIAPWTDASLLRSYKYQKLKRGEDPIQRALEQHSLTKDGLAYNND